MGRDFQNRSQDERLSLAEQLQDLYRLSTQQRRQQRSQEKRQGTLTER
jgi:hypothetical protein